MEQERLSKKGHVTKATTGEIVIVNEKGKAYAVTESIMAIWEAFTDKTVDEVAMEIVPLANRDPAGLIKPVSELASQLREAELLA